MRTFHILTAALTIMVAANAQDQTIKTRLMPLALGGSVHGLYFQCNGKAVEMHANITGLSEGIDYTGPAIIAIYPSKAELAQASRGEEAAKPLTTVTLPKGADRVLLLIAPAAQDGSPPTIRAFGVSTTDLRAGDYRLFNLTRQDVAALLGDQKAALRPGGVATLRNAKWNRDMLDLPIKLGARSESGRSRLLYSTVWGHQPNRRNFILILSGASNASPLDVRRFHDDPQADMEAPSSSE